MNPLHWIGERVEYLLHPAYLAFIALVAIAAPTTVYMGYLDLAKYALCTMFLSAGLCSSIGYFRYRDKENPRAPALLVLLLDKNFIFSYLGIGFLVSAITQSSSPSLNFSLLLIYSSFGAAAAAMFFTGVFVLLGAGRGWILKEVYKNPFRRR